MFGISESLIKIKISKYSSKLTFSVADPVLSWVQVSIFEDRQKRAKELKNSIKEPVRGQNLTKIFKKIDVFKLFKRAKSVVVVRSIGLADFTFETPTSKKFCHRKS